VKTDAGTLTLPAQPYAGIRKDTIAIPLGQGHVACGRYARGRGVNALDLLPPAQDAGAGALAYLSVKAKVAKSPARIQLAHTQRDFSQEERGIARIVPLTALYGLPRDQKVDINSPRPGIHALGEYPGEMEAKPGGISLPSQHKPGKYTEPRETPPGYKPPAHSVSAYQFEEVVRSPRQIPVDKGSYKNAAHRWAMAIDIDSCNGCSACMVACSAENNVPTVGPDMVTHGREMWWIRINRIEQEIGDGKSNGKSDVRFVPMMCQHCGNAPCEIVCPVYATYHNPEGLNAQVYNRCVGTRYCSNNCPYKVRVFNFYDYSAPEKPSFAFPEPLNWQLNPDVTVRSKGVMEKCTMCIQRILEGKGNARDENRTLRDGDIKTACQQTCPTRAITFGDLLDPDSEVAKLSYGERAYWPLDELNTRPGVTYLKKIERETT
jgi:Fe-S-cluster-containing dehydrogenase component